MKKIFFTLLFTITAAIYGQGIKLFDTYVKSNNGETRYATVLTDNSLWVCDPSIANWSKIGNTNLPPKYDIKFFSPYVKQDGKTRFVICLADNSVWWCLGDEGSWSKVATTNLPSNANVKSLSIYVKPSDETRYVLAFDNNTLWWCDPAEANWTQVSTTAIMH